VIDDLPPELSLDIDFKPDLFKKYVNLKTGNEAVVVYEDNAVVTIKYLKNDSTVNYRKAYFEQVFNPVTEEK
jgi:hypothetical protein